MVNTSKSLDYKLGMQSWLRFKITQHTRDVKLMENFKEYFSCGSCYLDSDIVNFVVTKFSDIDNKILPFFNDYPLQGVKVLDFEDFKKLADIIRVKGHRSSEGLEELLKIKAGMNKGRSKE